MVKIKLNHVARKSDIETKYDPKTRAFTMTCDRLYYDQFFLDLEEFVKYLINKNL